MKKVIIQGNNRDSALPKRANGRPENHLRKDMEGKGKWRVC